MKNALDTYEKNGKNDVKSLSYQLLGDDKIRRDCMIETGFLPQLKVINWDFNFYTTVYRALNSSYL